MQNPISYRSLRALFIPEEKYINDNDIQSTSKQSNLLTQMMPITQITAGVANSYTHQVPVYITVKRRIACLNTKDIFFGIFKTNFSMNDTILFEDVDNNILRILKTDDILAICRPK